MKIQAAFRRYLAVQHRVYLQLSRAARANRQAAVEIQRFFRAHMAQKRLSLLRKTTLSTPKPTPAATKRQCRYKPCTKSYCWFTHVDGQQRITPRKPKSTSPQTLHAAPKGPTDAEPRTECPVCFMNLTFANVGLFDCGHCACLSCAERCVSHDSKCPICRTPCTKVLKMRV